MVMVAALECSLHIKELKGLFPKHTWRKRKYFMELPTLGLFRAPFSLRLRLKVSSFFLPGKQEALDPFCSPGSHPAPQKSGCVFRWEDREERQSGKEKVPRLLRQREGCGRESRSPSMLPTAGSGAAGNTFLLPQTHSLFAPSGGTSSVSQGLKHICK